MKLAKTHAFGNDFLLADASAIAAGRDEGAFARAVCDRHTGVGADGLLIYTSGSSSAVPSMRLLNADGSRSEISGNGLRCLAAWFAHAGAGQAIDIATDAGVKRLQLLDRAGERYTFRAAMGPPEQIRMERIVLDRASAVAVDAVTLRVGNPQCVVLGDVSVERLHSVASRLAVHPHFPEGTNVELARVERPDHVRILIWERGVGPTEASGTGACAAAVAAMQYGGAARDVGVESPGGVQRVEWTGEGLFLTGWAQIVATVEWLADGRTA
jgi:diaminopimelate epimerase